MLARSGFSLPTRTTLTGDWADLLREHFVALDVSDIEDGDRFSGAVHSAQLAHVRVSAVQSMEQRIVRSSSLIKSDGADYLQIGMIRRGSAVVRQDDRECVLRRGDYVLYDTTRPFDWQIEGHAHDGIWGLEVFTWPRSYLSLSDAEVTSLTAIAFDGHAGLSGLLGRFLHDLASVRMTSDASGDEEEVVNEIGNLVKVRSSHNCATDHLAANQPLRIRPVGHRRPHRRPGPVSGGHRGIGQSLHSAVAPSLRRTRHDGVTVDSQPSTRRLPS